MTKSDDSLLLVDRMAGALIAAARKYKELDESARLNGVCFDGDVKAELAGATGEDADVEAELAGTTGKDFPLEIPILVNALEIAQRSVGRICIDAYKTTGRVQVFVNQVSSGHIHGVAVVLVVRAISNATEAFEGPSDEFVAVGGDGMYGDVNGIINAPDCTVHSLWDSNGRPTGSSLDGLLFLAEVENGNRSLPELIRCMEMLLANFQSLNAVLGMKCEDDTNGNKVHAFILIAWCTVSGVRAPHVVTKLFDFGPYEYSDMKKNNATAILQLPLPPAATKPIAGVHGAVVVAAHLLPWTRMVSGRDAQHSADHILMEIPASLLVTGAHSQGTGAPITIPLHAVPARLNLASLSRIFCRQIFFVWVEGHRKLCNRFSPIS
jgi:hypothetical protein